jgi:nucleotide-binding universal stress UspA family protein
MFNRILVPLDGSALAERAIPHAEQFARIFGSNIFLLQVLDPSSYHENHNPIDPLGWQIRKTEADMYMNKIAARIRENLEENTRDAQDAHNAITQSNTRIKNRVEYSIQEGKTAENIVNFAHAKKIDLLVISTHGSGGLSRWNISSVIEKVVNLIYLSVLIVRAYDFPETERTRIHYHRILLPIDSSRRAESSLSAGIALARGDKPMGLSTDSEGPSLHQAKSEASVTQTKLILAAVIKPPEFPIPKPYPTVIEKLSAQLMDISREAVKNYLSEMKERLDVECEICVVENDSVSFAIQELAIQEEIDLVVLCAHGYTGQSIWPYGSITRNYMEHGTKPVLVIQDVHRSQIMPTAAEIAAENSGDR